MIVVFEILNNNFFVNLVTKPKEPIVISAVNDNHVEKSVLMTSVPVLPKTDLLIYPSEHQHRTNGIAHESTAAERHLPSDGSNGNYTSNNADIAKEGAPAPEPTAPVETHKDEAEGEAKLVTGSVVSAVVEGKNGSVGSPSLTSPVGSIPREVAPDTFSSITPFSLQESIHGEVAPVWSDIVSGEDHYNSPDTGENRSAMSDGYIDDYDANAYDEEYGYDNVGYGDEGVDEEEEEYSEEEGQGDYAQEEDW